MPPSKRPHKPYDSTEIVRRVNRARGMYLDRFARDMDWSEIGQHLRLAPSTVTDVKSGKRPLRVAEIAQIGELLKVSPGWLAFEEGNATGAPSGRRDFTTHDPDEKTGRELEDELKGKKRRSAS